MIYRAVVTRAFLCKVQGVHFRVGSAYLSADPARITYLQSGGYLGKEELEEPNQASTTASDQLPADDAFLVPEEVTPGAGEAESGESAAPAAELVDQNDEPPAAPEQGSAQDDERLEHVGGGYFLLPNGEKVRGKENALLALEALDAAAAALQDEE
ncbi:hypothetical protein ACFFSY_29500 [Paenibacillus aurantiacus]|uniref:Uncharacterized protein n=1 Tax=Paenibacillus aurantiacus TaxID=1936118 RepID=A0ABV5KY01_9BACL